MTIREVRNIEKGNSGSISETVEFTAVEAGKRIFRAKTVVVRRTKCCEEAPFDEWFIVYGGSNSASTYKESLPHVATINAAMEFLKQQEEGGE